MFDERKTQKKTKTEKKQLWNFLQQLGKFDLIQLTYSFTTGKEHLEKLDTNFQPLGNFHNHVSFHIDAFDIVISTVKETF